MECPEPDHYSALGVTQTASTAQTRKAYLKLAKIHHPDKKAPGQRFDAVDFRKILDAKEFLSDAEKRTRYDQRYSDIQDQWTRYHQWQTTQRHEEHQTQAEVEARRRMAAEMEEARKQHEERARARRKEEADRRNEAEEERRAAAEKQKQAELRAERIRQAEERSREAARRARQQQEEAPRERIRRQKEAEAERRSQQAIRRRQVEQAREAAERLKLMQIKEKQIVIRSNWSQLRQDAEERQTEVSTQRPSQRSPTTPACLHPGIRWPRKKGRANCVFAESALSLSFHCPLYKVAGSSSYSVRLLGRRSQ